ncbi:MAG: murein hydrolase activator EnvC family protein [Acidimicrobiales bacterium]
MVRPLARFLDFRIAVAARPAALLTITVSLLLGPPPGSQADPLDPMAARCGASALGAGLVGGAPFELWDHPVDAPIVDGFRPPSTPYGPGNLGLEYQTAAGDPVSAATSGMVSFAGQVGGPLYLVVQHESGLRVTYSFLQRIDVAVGEVLTQGQPVAEANTGFHLTVRDGPTYIDPMPFMADFQCYLVRLVPVPDAPGRVIAAR